MAEDVSKMVMSLIYLICAISVLFFYWMSQNNRSNLHTSTYYYLSGKKLFKIPKENASLIVKQPKSHPITSKYTSILNRFSQRWNITPPITENSGKCGYIFVHGYSRSRTADQMFNLFGYYLAAVNTGRQLILPRFPVYPVGYPNGLQDTNIVQDCALIPNMHNYNLSMEEFNGETNSSVLAVQQEISRIPCGVHIGVPKNLSHPIVFTGSMYFARRTRFNAVRNLFRSFFKFKPEFLNACKKRFAESLEKLHSKNSNCGVIVAHVRRTDYVGRTEKVRPITRYYLQEAFRNITQRFVNNGLFDCSVLLLISDDPAWTRTHAPPGTNVLTLNTSKDPMEDLCIMASADASIITIGNYGWAGAYFSGKVAAYQQNQRQLRTPLMNWVPIPACPPNLSTENIDASCIPATTKFKPPKIVYGNRTDI